LKKKNVLQKFGKFYDSLSDDERRQIMDLLSCWRGPDSEDQEMKTRTSAKIRYEILKYVKTPMPAEKMLGRTYWLHTFSSCEFNAEKLTSNDVEICTGHFRAHLSAAYHILKEIGEL